MSELFKIQQALKVPKSQRNNFGKYNYRSCEDILEALKKPLADNECYVTISDSIELVGDRYYVKSVAALKKDGKTIDAADGLARESQDKKGMDESQITGAASSYARKYALNGLFAIDDTQDADSVDSSQGSPPSEPEKPWLNSSDRNLWNRAVNACKNNGDLSIVLQSVRISKDNQEKIMKEAGII